MTTTEARVELVDEVQLRLALMEAMAFKIATVTHPYVGSCGGDSVRIYVKIDGELEDTDFAVDRVSFSVDRFPDYITAELDSHAAEYGQLDARIEVTFEGSKFISARLLQYKILEGEEPE